MLVSYACMCLIRRPLNQQAQDNFSINSNCCVVIRESYSDTPALTDLLIYYSCMFLFHGLELHILFSLLDLFFTTN